MRKVQLCVVFILAMSTAAADAFAAVVCVSVFERGLGADPRPGDATYAWESGILNAFFEAGHIICNSPAERLSDTASLSGAFPLDASLGVDVAVAGGADFLALVVLDYGNAVVSSGIHRYPSSVSFRLQNLNTREIVAEASMDNCSRTAKGEEDLRNAEEFARKMIVRMKDR